MFAPFLSRIGIGHSDLLVLLIVPPLTSVLEPSCLRNTGTPAASCEVTLIVGMRLVPFVGGIGVVWFVMVVYVLRSKHRNF